MTATTITRPPATKAAATWQIDPAHSQVGFEVTHLMFAKVRGRFRTMEGTLWLGPEGADSGSRVEAVIQANSIDTANADRDAHLRSADFFDVERFPELRFTSRSVRRVAGGTVIASGDLTVRGVTRPADLAIQELGTQRDPWGHDRVAYSASTAIDRRDFGLTWNQALEAGGIAVGHEVRITLDIQAVRADQ